MWQALLEEVTGGNTKALARCISLVENEYEGYESLLESLPASPTKIVGITGPPGAGKSTLTDALIEEYIKDNKKVAVVCVDPSSPFNMGALLGDRIRMSDWYNHPSVFIRSLASKGSVGGLHPKIIEVTDIIKSAGFDIVIIETVGVGQSEIEIAGLADCTIVVLVPEAGDEVQTMKSGLMEIADIFVVNKADRPGAATFANNLKKMLAPEFHQQQQDTAIVKTIASKKEGIDLLKAAIETSTGSANKLRKKLLQAEKAYQLITNKRMRDVSKPDLKIKIDAEGEDFNLYRFVNNY